MDKINVLSKDQELPPSERTWASIGYSIFDKKNDKNAEAVFKRADEQMYINKRKMKGNE